jgi:hypothetical protein
MSLRQTLKREQMNTHSTSTPFLFLGLLTVTQKASWNPNIIKVKKKEE